ncbi:response regulator transcription factor [Paenibacillus radicis (ex Gao et al. 2016)]|uniref:DNA-binding response regulator n=1 Tax=Paenibacillus radicis (ex Gao et al. 2016) TaxID=1737354 RepID=A0A917H195_9BACL|nr:response regulator transcription factor [Paenibacillus radicis (ex Gao et al. 2016)]GGG64347.1 DNA-binding response regulator [Paenibacillus radicis (ex Gao et al. 2016)]
MYRVFIVDDEPFIIEGLYDIIDWPAYGLEIVGSAENGKDALEALKGLSVDILLTDISMPVMDGLTLIREARQFHPELKVIILSGYNEFDYIKSGLKLGVENYLLKPINIDELQETLANTIDKLDQSRPDRMFSAYDIRILRDNILYRWLTRRIASNELKERTEMLDIRLDAPYLAIAVLRTDSPAKPFYDALQQLADEDKSMLPFVDIDGDQVIIFLFSELEQGKAKALDILNGLQKEMISGGNPLRISLGSVVQTEEGAPVSYAQAKEAQEYFLLHDEPVVLDYESLAERGGNRSQTAFALDWAPFSKLIKAKELDQLHEAIEAEFEQYQMIDGITPAYIQSMAIEMMIRFKMELKEIKRADQPELYKAGFVQIMQADKIEELAAVVKEAATLTVDSLIRDVKSPIIQQLLTYVHDNYAQPLSLKSLSQQYNIHPVYLGHLFQKETSETFTDYINKYRIDKAKEMLKDTQLKVQEIAMQVGYWETGYFYKQFKKYVGISPTDYKGLL